MGTGDQKFTLQVLWQSEDAIRVTPFKQGSVLESTIKTSRTCPFHSQLVAERAQDILSILARANAGESGLLPELEAAGQAIYVDLLPAFLKEKLEEAAAPNLLLHLDRQLVGIPWELLHDGDAFLGRRFRIGRVVSMETTATVAMQRSMRSPLSVLIVADPCGDLPAARTEAEELAEVLEASPSVRDVTTLMGRVTTRQLRDALGRHDVLHFAGHADARRGAASLRLADGAFSAKLLDQLRGRIDFPGLVFLNGCGSADDTVKLSEGTDPLGAVSGIAASFLMSGVRHVVGTLWEVRDEVARAFALAFYQALGRGVAIGGATAAGQDAILERWGEDSLLWPAHLLYGDPTWSVDPPNENTLDDFAVLDGLEAKSRAELASADPATRLMAAAMLLRLGDHSVIPALGRDLDTLEAWLSRDAPQREQRLAAHVLQALAAAAGLQPSGPPDQLPDTAAVRALFKRLNS